MAERNALLHIALSRVPQRPPRTLGARVRPAELIRHLRSLRSQPLPPSWRVLIGCPVPLGWGLLVCIARVSHLFLPARPDAHAARCRRWWHCRRLPASSAQDPPRSRGRAGSRSHWDSEETTLFYPLHQRRRVVPHLYLGFRSRMDYLLYILAGTAYGRRVCPSYILCVPCSLPNVPMLANGLEGCPLGLAFELILPRAA